MDSAQSLPATSLPLGMIRLDSNKNIIFADERAATLLSLDCQDASNGHSGDCHVPAALHRLVSHRPLLLEWNNKKVVLQALDLDPDNSITVLIQDISDWHYLWNEFEKHWETTSTRDNLGVILNSSFDEIMVINRQGVIEQVNKVAEANYGLRVKEMIGMSVTELERRGLFSPGVTPLVLRDQCSTTIAQRTRTGKQLVVTGNPIFDGHDQISRIIVSSRDITELTKLTHQTEGVELPVKRYYNLTSLQQSRTSETEIICASPQMARIVALSDKIAMVDSTVLIMGESGVGKGLIAERIHKHSRRAGAPFTPINCGAIPEALLESELFGYERGAFTGANKDGKKGLMDVSHEGTVFLDEVAELPLNIQVKLLNLIQEKKFYRVGGNRQVSVDIRFIAATNRDIQKMVSNGTFREDLYYRLNVVPLLIPPLRHRREDIPPLINLILKHLNAKLGGNKIITPKVEQAFTAYSWPGNIRELENILEHLIVTCDNELIAESDLPDCMLGHQEAASTVTLSDLCPLRVAREDVERQLFSMAYRKSRNTYEIARMLGVNQSTVVRKLHQYQLTADAGSLANAQKRLGAGE